GGARAPRGRASPAAPPMIARPAPIAPPSQPAPCEDSMLPPAAPDSCAIAAAGDSINTKPATIRPSASLLKVLRFIVLTPLPLSGAAVWFPAIWLSAPPLPRGRRDGRRPTCR